VGGAGTVGAVGYYGLTRWLDLRAESEDPDEPVEEAEVRAGLEAEPAGADATAGRSSLGSVLLRFGAIVVLGAIAGAAGYAVLDTTDTDVIAVLQSIAVGAMIVVTVNEMIPLAVRGAARRAGLAAAGGFATAAFLATLT
jgi:zinc transporter, ZIP family